MRLTERRSGEAAQQRQALGLGCGVRNSNPKADIVIYSLRAPRMQKPVVGVAAARTSWAASNPSLVILNGARVTLRL